MQYFFRWNSQAPSLLLNLGCPGALCAKSELVEFMGIWTVGYHLELAVKSHGPSPQFEKGVARWFSAHKIMTIDFGLFLKFLGAVSRWVETLVCFAQKKKRGEPHFSIEVWNWWTLHPRAPGKNIEILWNFASIGGWICWTGNGILFSNGWLIFTKTISMDFLSIWISVHPNIERVKTSEELKEYKFQETCCIAELKHWSIICMFVNYLIIHCIQLTFTGIYPLDTSRDWVAPPKVERSY